MSLLSPLIYDIYRNSATISYGSDIANAELWRMQRTSFLRSYTNHFVNDCDTVDITLGRTAVQAACDAARAAGRPLQLISTGSMSLDIGNTVWAPKPNNVSDPLVIFAVDPIEIIGDAAIEVTQNLQMYGLTFRNSSAGSPRKTLAYPSTVTADDVTIIGNRFIPDVASAAIYGSSTQVHKDTLVRWNEFINCSYAMLSFSVCLSDICDNRSVMPVNGGGRHFFRNGGGAMRYLRNYCKGGVTGITGMHDHSSSTFTSYPHMQSFVDDLIDGNVLEYISEEYIGYDVQTNSAAYHPCLTITTVSATAGAAATQPLLNCTWDGVTSITQYAPGPSRFAHVIGPVGHALVGKYVQVRSVTNAAGTIQVELRGIGTGSVGLKATSASGMRRGELRLGELTQADFAGLVGAIISLGDLAVAPRITNNILICRGAPNRHTTVISLWGSVVGFLIKGNTFVNHGADPTNLSYHGIRITHVTGIGAKPKSPTAGHCNWGNTQINSKDLVQFPCSYGIVTRNSLNGTALRCNNATYAGAGDNLLVPYPGISITDNYDVAGGNAAIVGLWQGTDGTHASNTPVIDTTNVLRNTAASV